jgi:hypothetical protein
MHDFQLPIDLDRFTLSRLQLSGNGGIVSEVANLRIMGENEWAAKQHYGERDEQETNDPWGTDLSAHVCTFL